MPSFSARIFIEELVFTRTTEPLKTSAACIFVNRGVRLRARVFGLWLSIPTVIATSLLTVSVPTVVMAQPQPKSIDPEVQKHFSTANDLYGERRYPDALVEYDAAYELSKNYKILYNRGPCLVMLRREPEAIDSFEHYLNDGGNEIAEERRRQVAIDIEKLKQRLGTIDVEGAPNGSEVYVDDRFYGTTPLPKPISAGAGTHDLLVKPPDGRAPFSSTAKVVAGIATIKRVEIAASTPAPPRANDPLDVPPPPPPPPPTLPERKPGGLVAPSFVFDLGLGLTYAANERMIPQAELGLALRASPFWEVGVWAGGASGKWPLNDQVVNAEAATNRNTLDVNAGYSYGTLGIRARMHIARGNNFDGWIGVELGGFTEHWVISGSTKSYEGSATAPLLGLSVGVDVPLSKAIAIGLASRYVGSSADYSGSALPAFGNPAIAGSTRGLFEFGLRAVWSIPVGSEKKDPTIKPADASTPATFF
ncbi:MAG: hypothetical protein NVSMB1_00990 [Polyangiales bacterium]